MLDEMKTSASTIISNRKKCIFALNKMLHTRLFIQSNLHWIHFTSLNIFWDLKHDLGVTILGTGILVLQKCILLYLLSKSESKQV